MGAAGRCVSAPTGCSPAPGSAYSRTVSSVMRPTLRSRCARIGARSAHRAHQLQRVAHLSGREVVGHDPVDVNGEQLLEQSHRIDLDLDKAGTLATRRKDVDQRLQSRRVRARIVLHQHHGVERTPVILRPTATHRALSTPARADRLSRIENDDAGARHGVDEARRQRGDAASCAASS